MKQFRAMNKLKKLALKVKVPTFGRLFVLGISIHAMVYGHENYCGI